MKPLQILSRSEWHGSRMLKQLFYEDFRVGDSWLSPCHIVTREDVSEFAQLTGDFNPLHLDDGFASESPFRRPIAHGLLGLSFAAGLSSESPAVHTIAFLGISDWSFIQPIYFGDRVHVVTEVVAAEPHGRKRGRIVWRKKLVNQNDETVQQGIFETLVACRNSQAKPVPETTKLLRSAVS
jgi:acyl dehydratase